MPRRGLTGSRIRARRIDIGMKQAELANVCGISPSYLNLIEHNRRRIAGKLLSDIAGALGVEISQLSEGAEQALLDELQAAAAGTASQVELDQAEEFAGRFPGWARLLRQQHRRMSALEHTIETLSDRLTHDPFLSASLHEVLSAATAMRSTSAILADEDDLDETWRRRFHRNLREDSTRLAEASRTLASYLDAGADASKSMASPQEEVEEWLDGLGYSIEALEHDPAADLDALLESTGAPASEATRALARGYLEQYAADVRAIPASDMSAAVESVGSDPSMLQGVLGAALPTLLRRLSAMPKSVLERPAGLAICDGSGTLIFRKPVEGFAIPRFGAGCAVWPLYQALGRPMTPIRQVLRLSGRQPRHFLTHAVSEVRQGGFNMPQVVWSYMLITPVDAPRDGDQIVPAGISCRICLEPQCPARRELPVISHPD